MKKLIYIIPIVFLFLFLPALSYALCNITVHPGGSIQTAISNAVPGNTVCIEPGTYKEQISLIDGITLQGNELARTIINGDGTGTGSVVTAANSTTIMNVTITNSVTSNSAVGITVANIDSVTVKNVIIKNNATGINCLGSTTITVDHAVIDRNKVGINLTNNPIFSISNSIISNNTAGDLTVDNANLLIGVSHNLIFNNTPTAYPPSDTTSIRGEDPLFVLFAANDYHLQNHTPPSRAIDAGTGDKDPDGSTADIGAYGGPNMDTAPFPVSINTPTVPDSCAAPRCVTVTWTANIAYNITGYKVYFDSDTSGPPYNGRTTAGVTSPADVGPATSESLTGLSVPDTTLVPTGLSTKPGNGKITVRWNQVPGAKGYLVHYRISDDSTSNSIDVGNTTSAVISGLTNDTQYSISVSAYFQTTYYLSVSAYDKQGHESALVNEVNIEFLPRTDGRLSGEVPETPEETLPFPDLGDENKCFIATAAYGSPMEPQVILLRKFRDRFLLTNALGKKLVSVYYEFSPPFADFIREHSWLKPFVRIVLLPFIGIATFCLKLSFAQQFLICVFLTLSLASVFLSLKRRKRACKK